ncbi:MAG: CHAT domain-containing protein, partial [Cyanobacteria bacterium P01_H01_bin.119]
TYNNLEIVLIAQNKNIEALAITERGRAQAFALQLALRQGESADTVTYPSVTDIQRIAVEQNTTLVEYSLTRDRQALFIWVISPAGDIQFRQVSLSDLFTDTLTGFIQQTRDSLGVRGSRTTAAPQLRPDVIARLQAETDQNLKDLHNLLIEPIADLLPTDSDANVVFVPQGELFLVPFPALKDTDGTYLIEKHTISTAPSIQVLGLTNETSPSTPLRELPLPCLLRRRCANDSAQGAVLVGNPTMPTVTIPDANGLQEVQLSSLPGAQREAQAIGEFLNITPLIGDQATEAQVKAQLPNVDLIHLATHGLLEYGDPQALAVRDFPGAIALAPGNGEDGLLTASEILDMELQANLAVLSACDTGRGRITGDGVVGLSRALITAGVPSVVVSLWAVPDAPTAALMSEFYRQLDQGHSKAQALRQAMLITLEQSPDPKDWAAFTLIGAME